MRIYKVSTVDYCYCTPANLSLVIADYKAQASNYHTQIANMNGGITLKGKKEAIIAYARRSLIEFKVILNYYIAK